MSRKQTDTSLCLESCQQASALSWLSVRAQLYSSVTRAAARCWQPRRRWNQTLAVNASQRAGREFVVCLWVCLFCYRATWRHAVKQYVFIFTTLCAMVLTWMARFELSLQHVQITFTIFFPRHSPLRMGMCNQVVGFLSWKKSVLYWLFKFFVNYKNYFKCQSIFSDFNNWH